MDFGHMWDSLEHVQMYYASATGRYYCIRIMCRAGTLSRRRLNPTKLARWSVPLIVSNFNQLGQYVNTKSPGNRVHG